MIDFHPIDLGPVLHLEFLREGETRVVRRWEMGASGEATYTVVTDGVPVSVMVRPYQLARKACHAWAKGG